MEDTKTRLVLSVDSIRIEVFMIKALLIALLSLSFGVAGTPLTVTALGDSLTIIEAGMGRILSERLGREVRYENIGIGGAGTSRLYGSLLHNGIYMTRMKKNPNPDVILVALGTNDGLTRDLRTLYKSALTELTHRFPNALIITLGPPEANLARLTHLVEIRQMQAQVSRELGITWIDRDVPCELAGDGVHQTRRGYELLAQHTAKQIIPIIASKVGR